MPGPSADTFATRLKALMKAKGVNNPEVAQEVGVDPVTVSQWRSGRQRPGDDTLNRLADFLGTTPEHLRYGALASVVREVTEDAYGALPRHARNLPLAVREYLIATERRLHKGGASEEEIEEAMALLRSPDIFSYSKGGALRDYDEEKVLRTMRNFVEGVIVPDLREQGRKIP